MTTMTIELWLAVFVCLATSPFRALSQAQLTQVVRKAPSSTTIQSPNKTIFASAGAPLQINVTSPADIATPDGTVRLSDGSVVIADVSLTSGAAILAETFSTMGVHQLTACYLGGANFSTSCSVPMNLTVVAPYSLRQTSASGVINAPSSFTDKLKVIPAASFSGLVQLACAAPANGCSLSTTSLKFSGDGVTQLVEVSFAPSTASPLAGFMILPFIGLIGVPTKRRTVRGVAFLIGLGVLGLTAGCGPVVSIPFSKANYSVLITSTSGAYNQAVTYDIQVDTTGTKQ
jgi:Bacterial Ig-like domain (group 3)